MEKEIFNFHVQDLSFGWCRVVMLINGKEIHYNASYLGKNPLASFIDACEDLYNEEGTYYVGWQAEPGMLDISLDLDNDNQLHLDIIDKDGDNESIKGGKPSPNNTIPRLENALLDFFLKYRIIVVYLRSCFDSKKQIYKMNALLERIKETLDSSSSSFLKEKDLDKRRRMIAATIYNVPVEDMENGFIIQALSKAVFNNVIVLSRSLFDDDVKEMDSILHYVNNALLKRRIRIIITHPSDLICFFS